MNPTNIQKNSKGGIHLGALIEAPRQKTSEKFSCSVYAVVGTQFAHSQKQTQNSWDNQPGQQIDRIDCRLPRISR